MATPPPWGGSGDLKAFILCESRAVNLMVFTKSGYGVLAVDFVDRLHPRIFLGHTGGDHMAFILCESRAVNLHGKITPITVRRNPDEDCCCL